MNQPHSNSYDTRDGQVMPATYRRTPEFCSSVAESFGLRANVEFVKAHDNSPRTTAELVSKARVHLKNLGVKFFVVSDRVSAIAALRGIRGPFVTR